MNKIFRIVFFLVSFLAGGYELSAQLTVVSGRVTDELTQEPIPFANVYFLHTTIGTRTDFNGNYTIQTDQPVDTIVATLISYNKVKLPLKKHQKQTANFLLKVNRIELQEVVIKPGENPAHVLLRKVQARRDSNDKDQLNYYQYEAYNKIEFDITNVPPDLKKKKLFKPFAFIFDNIDSTSTNEKPFLPMFISESVSDLYFRKNPSTKKEYIKATKSSGMENATITQFLGDMYQNTNVYNHFIPIFGKSFVSPISGIGLMYYRYYLVDSLFIGSNRCYKVTFKPRRKQELTFSGEMWISDTTYAIKKINMNIAPDANINFVNDIAIAKEYNKVEGNWMLTRDVLVIDFMAKDNGLGFIGRKTTSYRDIVVNKPQPEKIYSGNEPIVILDSAKDHDASFWKHARHDSLAKRERKIYAMVDTIKSLPIYKTYVDVITTVITGYKKTGPIDIGPYFSLYSYNEVEGHKFRLGLRTNNDFSKTIGFDAFGAYGTRDNRFKYGVGIDYLVGLKPRRVLRLEYKKDVEQLGNNKNVFQENNPLISFFRRLPNNKLTGVETRKLSYDVEWFTGFSSKIAFNYESFTPLGVLDYSYYQGPDRTIKNVIHTGELQLSARYAYREKVISGKLRRISLGTKYPIFQLILVKGIKGFDLSGFHYHKIVLAVAQKVMLGTLGHTRYNVEGGKIFGNLPLPLLEVHKGNEAYTYDNRSFNLMNYYEFVSDQYVSVYLTHHFEGLFLNRVPLVRKLKWREVACVRAVKGTLSRANIEKQVDPNGFYTLTVPYVEAGIGLENILKLIRVEAIWRLNYLDHPDIAKFGIRANLQFTF